MHHSNHEVGGSELIIEETARDDKGYYTIKATNAAGVANKQIKVVILSETVEEWIYKRLFSVPKFKLLCY